MINPRETTKKITHKTIVETIKGNKMLHLMQKETLKEEPVQFSRSVVSDSATPWIAARQASLSISNSRVHSDSRPSSLWCYPAISSWVVPFSCPQSLPASESFPMSQLFTWGGKSIGVLALASVLPMNTQDWSPLGWTGWISLQWNITQLLKRTHLSQF